MPVEYTYSAVAFLDVLGWSDLVERSVQQSDLRNAMAVSIGRARQVLTIGGTQLPQPGSGLPLVGQFSDSIVISLDLATGAEWGAFGFAMALDGICKSMLERGFFVRGGVTEGLMYHHDTVAFGPALTRAAKLEKDAVYPRVIIDDLGHDLDVPIWCRTFRDEKRFFDVLSPNPDTLGFENSRQNQIGFLNAIRSVLPDNLAALRGGSEKEQRIYEKHEWFRAYFNDVAEQCGAPVMRDRD